MTWRREDHGLPIWVDFDATLNVDGGERPQEGALEAVQEMLRWGMDPFIYTSRPLADEVEEWLKRHGFPALDVYTDKPIAFAHIDDRSIAHRGNWERTMDELRRMLGVLP